MTPQSEFFNQPKVDDTEIQRIGKKTGLSTVIVAAVSKLSAGHRQSIKLALLGLRTQFQSIFLTAGYKQKLAYRRQVEAVKSLDIVSGKLDALSTIFNKMDQLRGLVSLLIQASGNKKLSGTYRDIEAARYKAAFQARQAERAGHLHEVSARQITSKIAEIDKYIALIDYIEKL